MTYDDPIEQAGRAVLVPGLEVIDLAVGAFGVVLPSGAAPMFFRLGRSVGGPIDRARASYLLVANAHLRAGIGGWIDGPGIATRCNAGSGRGAGSGASHAASDEVLCAEIETMAPALRALGENERFARAYLELHVGVVTNVDDPANRPTPADHPTRADQPARANPPRRANRAGASPSRSSTATPTPTPTKRRV